MTLQMDPILMESGVTTKSMEEEFSSLRMANLSMMANGGMTSLMVGAPFILKLPTGPSIKASLGMGSNKGVAE